MRSLLSRSRRLSVTTRSLPVDAPPGRRPHPRIGRTAQLLLGDEERRRATAPTSTIEKIEVTGPPAARLHRAGVPPVVVPGDAVAARRRRDDPAAGRPCRVVGQGLGLLVRRARVEGGGTLPHQPVQRGRPLRPQPLDRDGVQPVDGHHEHPGDPRRRGALGDHGAGAGRRPERSAALPSRPALRFRAPGRRAPATTASRSAGPSRAGACERRRTRDCRKVSRPQA